MPTVKGHRPSTKEPLQNPALRAFSMELWEIELENQSLPTGEIDYASSHIVVNAQKDQAATPESRARFVRALKAVFKQHGMTLYKKGNGEDYIHPIPEDSERIEMHFNIPPEILKKKRESEVITVRSNAAERLEQCYSDLYVASQTMQGRGAELG